MSLNCSEIDLILQELDLEGSFIQQIVQPGYDSLAFYTYKCGKSKTIYVSLAAGSCRINETRKKIPKNDKPLRFMEFLKSRIKGARINSCSQIGKERVIKFELAHEGEIFLMFIRLWSNSANIIVCDRDLKILDVFYRRPNRNEVSGGTFVLPEIRPAQKTFEVRKFEELASYENFESMTFNEKVELYYSEHAESLSREALLEEAEKIYREHKSRMEGAIKRLEEKRQSFLANDEWKHDGDLILTYGHLIGGDEEFLECQDYDSGETVRIKIDPKKNAQDNAKVYYDKYKKAVSGLEELEYDISKAKKELLDLDAAYDSIQKEVNPIKIQQLIRKQTKPKQQQVKKHPGLAYMINGWYILVGRDAGENDELLRHHVKGQDMWMHTRDFAGGYVFIKNRPGKTIPLDILLNAGNLAVHHSKARKTGQADLYYTQVKYLRRAKNGPKGLVLPTHEKNITIKLEESRLKIMEEAQIED
ncbi:MAG: NFACT RNA binding domain-containing protein [Treponemataceae bacterium]|nr:NFACT RNA binding domain-containing protein [Treponemataceae bacterium]